SARGPPELARCARARFRSRRGDRVGVDALKTPGEHRASLRGVSAGFLREQVREPRVRELLVRRALTQPLVQEVEVDLVERLVLLEAGVDEALLPGLGIHAALQALPADLLHHALHRRVDAPERDLRAAELLGERPVSRVAHRAHHPRRADREHAIDLAEREHALAELTALEGLHRLHDVAAEVAVSGPPRRDRRTFVVRPDHLIRARLDLALLEELRAVAIAREIEHA